MKYKYFIQIACISSIFTLHQFAAMGEEYQTSFSKKAFTLTNTQKYILNLPVFRRKSGAIRLMFYPDSMSGSGNLVNLDGLRVTFGIHKNKKDRTRNKWQALFRLYWTDTQGKEHSAKWALSRPILPSYRVELAWTNEGEALLQLNNSRICRSNYKKTKGKSSRLAKNFTPTTLTIGAGITGIIDQIHVYDARPSTNDFIGVQYMFSFESENDAAWWDSYDRTTPPPIQINGKGALGSKGFLHIGPQTNKWVAARLESTFIATAETWIGFSARRPDGGRLVMMLADGAKRKNAFHRFTLPADGAWKTFRVPLEWLYIKSGSPIRRITFVIGNKSHAPLTFDLDNVIVASGIPKGKPEPVTNITASFQEGAAYIRWCMPDSKIGIVSYIIYRGLHPAFLCNVRHRLGTSENAEYIDTMFAHSGEYFYRVIAVDFAGHKSMPGMTAQIDTRMEKHDCKKKSKAQIYTH